MADAGRQSDCIVRIPLIPGYNTVPAATQVAGNETLGFTRFGYSPAKSANTDWREESGRKILKEIRRQIAEANGIEFATSECRCKGDCLGTCPKCEAEVRYLSSSSAPTPSPGKAVAIAGISAGMILMSGAAAHQLINRAIH